MAIPCCPLAPHGRKHKEQRGDPEATTLRKGLWPLPDASPRGMEP